MIFLLISDQSPDVEGVINIDIKGVSTHSAKFENQFQRNQEYKQELKYSAKSEQSLGEIKGIDINFNGKYNRESVKIKEVFIKSLISRDM